MALVMAFFMGICLSCSVLALAQVVPTSTISAAPALLPTITSSSSPPPLSSPSPALSPADITPLFPSPGGDGPPPSESSLPIIPSSPSPPNPDDMAASGPNNMALSPEGSLPAISSSASSSSYSSLSSLMVFIGSVWFSYLILIR